MAGAAMRDIEFVVCLPENGPLRAELEKVNIETHITGVIKISRKQFTAVGLASLPWEIVTALRGISRVVAGRTIDAVYSNTVAVFAGALWAKTHGKPHIWQIREIIKKPALASGIFKFAVNRLSNGVICNSHETARWIGGNKLDPGFHHVVWNGVDASVRTGEADGLSSSVAIRSQMAVPLNILMVGRVNAWKGQDLLMDALDLLILEGEGPFTVTFVGGPPPGQPEWMTQLRERIEVSPLREVTTIVEFTSDISDYYARADLAVVPSREPEPFGRVAIEAMAASLPVVAAAHGGLNEIVDHKKTGFLVTPNDPRALADGLRSLLRSTDLRRQMGIAGRQRQLNMFSLTAYRRGVMEILDSATAAR
jgi:glycosyltransferase involved in cell wall biosynthesis